MSDTEGFPDLPDLGTDLLHDEDVLEYFLSNEQPHSLPVDHGCSSSPLECSDPSAGLEQAPASPQSKPARASTKRGFFFPKRLRVEDAEGQQGQQGAQATSSRPQQRLSADVKLRNRESQKKFRLRQKQKLTSLEAEVQHLRNSLEAANLDREALNVRLQCSSSTIRVLKEAAILTTRGSSDVTDADQLPSLGIGPPPSNHSGSGSVDLPLSRGLSPCSSLGRNNSLDRTSSAGASGSRAIGIHRRLDSDPASVSGALSGPALPERLTPPGKATSAWEAAACTEGMSAGAAEELQASIDHCVNLYTSTVFNVDAHLDRASNLPLDHGALAAVNAAVGNCVKEIIQISVEQPPVIRHLVSLNMVTKTFLEHEVPDGHWALVLAAMHMTPEQERVGLIARADYLARLREIDEEYRSILASLQPHVAPTSVGNREIAAVCITAHTCHRRMAENLRLLHVTHLEFSATLFGDILSAVQTGTAGVASWPYYPDALAVLNVLATQRGRLSSEGGRPFVVPEAQ